MQITQAQLLRILPNAGLRAGVFVSPLNRALARFQINTPARVAAFLAQVGHESSHLTRLVENLIQRPAPGRGLAVAIYDEGSAWHLPAHSKGRAGASRIGRVDRPQSPTDRQPHLCRSQRQRVARQRRWLAVSG